MALRFDSDGTPRPRRNAPALLALGLTISCAHPAPSPRPSSPAAFTATAASAPAPPSPAPPTTPQTVTSPQPLPTLAGDNKLPEPWRTKFRAWLASQIKPTYVAVTRVEVVSNSVSVVLQRRSEVDGVCLQGPSKLDLIQYEGAPELTQEIRHFGDDCCPGTECVRTSEGWNLHYLSLLVDKNWKELAMLVPTKRKLVWSINGGEQPTVQLTRKQVAAGKLESAPGCGLVYDEPNCDALDDKAAGFTCRCDGGGYHVSYEWEREGAGFVLVGIAEDSH